MRFDQDYSEQEFEAPVEEQIQQPVPIGGGLFRTPDGQIIDASGRPVAAADAAAIINATQAVQEPTRAEPPPPPPPQVEQAPEPSPEPRGLEPFAEPKFEEPVSVGRGIYRVSGGELIDTDGYPVSDTDSRLFQPAPAPAPAPAPEPAPAPAPTYSQADVTATVGRYLDRGYSPENLRDFAVSQGIEPDQFETAVSAYTPAPAPAPSPAPAPTPAPTPAPASAAKAPDANDPRNLLKGILASDPNAAANIAQTGGLVDYGESSRYEDPGTQFGDYTVRAIKPTDDGFGNVTEGGYTATKNERAKNGNFLQTDVSYDSGGNVTGSTLRVYTGPDRGVIYYYDANGQKTGESSFAPGFLDKAFPALAQAALTAMGVPAAFSSALVARQQGADLEGMLKAGLTAYAGSELAPSIKSVGNAAASNVTTMLANSGLPDALVDYAGTAAKGAVTGLAKAGLGALKTGNIDLGTAILGGAAGGVGGQLAGDLTSNLSLGDSTVLNNAAAAAARAAITGKDVSTAVATSLANSVAGSVVPPSALGAVSAVISKTLPPAVKKAVTKGGLSTASKTINATNIAATKTTKPPIKVDVKTLRPVTPPVPRRVDVSKLKPIKTLPPSVLSKIRKPG